jgi:hypothetical protein
MQRVFHLVSLAMLLLTSALWAQTPKNTAYKAEPGEGTTGAMVRGLFTDWMIWALLLGLIALIGVFIWLRNRSTED